MEKTKLKKVEYVQSAYNGGFPAPNEAGFEHGQGVYIVDKKYLDALEAEVALRIDLTHLGNDASEPPHS